MPLKAGGLFQAKPIPAHQQASKGKACEQCGKEHMRKRFCSNRCKDRWHNRENPRGYGLLRQLKGPDGDFDNTHPYSEDAFTKG